MKKKFILIFLMFFVVFVAFADSENYHWYRSSTGTIANVFPDVVGEGSDEEDEDGGGSGDSGVGDWLLFSTSEGIYLDNNCKIKGKTGTNSADNNSVVFGNNTEISTNKLYIGVGANSTDVVTGFTGAIINLEENELFIKPSYFNHTVPDIPNNLVNKGSVKLKNNEEAEITESGIYSEINLKNNNKLYLKTVADRHLVLDVEDLILDNNNQIIVQGEGKVYLFITNSLDINNNTKIIAERDSLYLIIKNISYGKTIISNNFEFNGYIYFVDCQHEEIELINNLKIYQLYIKNCPNTKLIIDNNVELKHALFIDGLEKISTKNNLKFENGVVAYDTEIEIHNNLKSSMIYAPNSNLTVKNNVNLTGPAIIRKFVAKNNFKIEGEPFSYEIIPELFLPDEIDIYLY